MPVYQIHVVNCDFESCNDVEAADAGGAQRHGLRGALQIGCDELCKGETFFGAEVRVEIDGKLQQRIVVAMGTTPLR